MKSSFARITVATVFALIFCIQPSQAADAPVNIYDGNQWIVGLDINTYSCFSLDSKEQIPVLQFQVNKKWVNKVKGRVSKNNTYCEDDDYPYFVLFNLKMDTKGQISFGNKFKKQMKVRITIPKIKTYDAYYSSIITKNVYPSINSWNKEGESMVIEFFNQQLEDSIADAISGSSGGQSSSSASKLSGCILKNKQLFGKVQVVDYGADFKIQLVSYASDLKVLKVDYGASSCGKWQFVDYGANFKVQFVDYGADFKVQLVEYGQGLG